MLNVFAEYQLSVKIKIFSFSFRFHSQYSFIDNKMSPIYFLKVEFEDVGNSLDASSSDLTVIKVNGSRFFFTNKKKHKMHYIRLYVETVCVQWEHSYFAKNRN